MYRYFRNVHLFLGLFCCLFLLMYGISAFQMGHGRFFANTPVVTNAEFEIERAASGSARAAALELMSRHGMRGELMQVREKPGGWQFRIVRPGTVYEVSVDRESSRANVKTSVSNMTGMLNRIHHLRGLNHELSVLNVWGFLVAVIP